MIRKRPEEGAGGEATEGTTEATAAEATPASTSAPIDTSAFATKEDLQGLVQGLNYLTQMFQAPEEDPEEDDGGEIDIGAYINQAVESRLSPVRPLLDATVKERGEKLMGEIFDRVSQEDGVGDFDRKLAERMANSYVQEFGGDPVKATEEAAREAARIRREERKAGETSYIERLRRGPLDPEPQVAGAATKTRSKDKSYDDVIERWSGESEV